MKKILISILFTFIFLNTVKVSAQTFTPKNINIVTNSISPIMFKAGDTMNLKVMLSSSNLAADKTNISYGVARQIIDGNTTRYEYIKDLLVQKVPTTPDAQNIQIQVPNILDAYSSSTYVIYAKIKVTDDPDSENFIVSSNNFKIIPDNSQSLTKVQYVDLLNSNGKRYVLKHGLTIYDLNHTEFKGVASSTAIEITFESNTDKVLIPKIVFNKLRSDVSLPEFNPKPITIKKNTDNTSYIPLPTFDYEPGVYQGVLTFDDANIPAISFQYIVAGAMVTFGQPTYVSNDKNGMINFPTFGTPVDLDLDPSINKLSTSSMTYSTNFVFKDNNGKELYNMTDKIDFSTSTYSLSIPSNYKTDSIYKVSIKSVDKDGKVVYQGDKDLTIPKKANNANTLIILILILLTIISIFIFKHKYLRLVLILVLLLLSYFGFKSYANADNWAVPDAAPYLVSSSIQNNYTNHVGEVGKAFFTFNTNIETAPRSVNDDVIVTYKTTFSWCSNTTGGTLKTSLSLIGNNGLVKKSSDVNVYTSDFWHAADPKNFKYGHTLYTNTSDWITVNLGKPDKNSFVKADYLTNYLEFTYHKIAQPHIMFNIPLNIPSNTPQIVSCEPMTNITSSGAKINWSYIDHDDQQSSYQVQIATNLDFTADSIVKDITPPGNTDVSAVRSVDATGLNPNTTYYVRVRSSNLTNGWGPYSDCGDSFTTLPTNDPKNPATSCSCNNLRTETCTTGSNVVTTPGSSNCNLKSSCSFSVGSNDVTYTIIPTNGLGNLTYSRPTNVSVTQDNSTPYVFTLPKTPGVQTVVVTLTDSDRQTSQSTCTVGICDNSHTPGTTCPVDGREIKWSCDASTNYAWLSTLTGKTCPDPNSCDNSHTRGTDCPSGDIWSCDATTGYKWRNSTGGSCPTTPTIILIKDPLISISKGGSCTVNWTLKNIPSASSCKLVSSNITNPSTTILENFINSGSQIMSNIMENTKYTLSCEGGGMTPISAAVTCRIDPTSTEN